MTMYYYLIIMLLIIIMFQPDDVLSNVTKCNAFRLDVARNHVCNRVVSVLNGLPVHVVTADSLILFRKYLRTVYF